MTTPRDRTEPRLTPHDLYDACEAVGWERHSSKSFTWYNNADKFDRDAPLHFEWYQPVTGHDGFSHTHGPAEFRNDGASDAFALLSAWASLSPGRVAKITISSNGVSVSLNKPTVKADESTPRAAAVRAVLLGAGRDLRHER